MNVDGMVSLDVLHQVDVPLERNVWVVATLDQDLDATKSLELIDLGSDLLERERVAFAVFRSARKCAKPAISDADVGVIDVSIDDVGDRVSGMLFLANTIRFHAKLEEWSIRVKVE